MKTLTALWTIWRIVPGRVLVAISDGLEVGLKKHSTWDSDKGTEHYVMHLLGHLNKMTAGELVDCEDGHTNGAGVIIRAMQLTDAQLIQEESRCHGEQS